MTSAGAGAAGHALFVGADGRPRWFWRLLAFSALTFAATLVLLKVGYPLLAASAMSPDAVQFVALPWLTIGGLLVAHAASLAWVDRRSWSFVRLSRASLAPRRIALGVAVGALAIGVPVAALLGAGWLREVPATPGSWWGAALRFAVILLPFALSEELTFRGYPFAVLRERFGARAAVIATSVAFGLLHLGNPGSSAQAIATVMVAGVLLAGVLLVTESLYAAWAAHFAWNWTMAALMHAPVSGISVATPSYQLVDTGPDWATGGAWGPEGGVGALLGMAAGLWFLWSRFATRAFLGAARGGRGDAPAAAMTTTTEARPATSGGREER